ncbi:squalene/phytoene synthase family protein [Botrimarina hoheduenensis]|uniref:All-trans-phytoene synthase n=1 Tax=Botrimarina hoheduenensis TaxID=2528000 RepID=A0A5C5VYV6_9BACT|nr:squalene/phytoene synthase family protein [Botrimarina hoheduenensis]TWT43143.1 All-trans-phytoene synthase [Botrimarina hoheduenensis]
MMRRELIDELLQKTSRTFALAIPLLPEALCAEVGVGYLLFRIADTLEDAPRLGRDARIAELQDWITLLQEPTHDAAQQLAARWKISPPSDNEDYNYLLSETPAVIGALHALPSDSQAVILRHAIRSAQGMAETLAGADIRGSFRLTSLADLQQYCYYVAGIVGEMLTDLFALRLPPSKARDALANSAARFGEALQLVNILKDAPDDARDGRTYLPTAPPHTEVIALARDNLAHAARYAAHLEAAGAAAGMVAFVTLPRTLAEATLDELERGNRKVARSVVSAKLAEAQAIRSGQAT